jgi:hypothetical protein
MQPPGPTGGGIIRMIARRKFLNFLAASPLN